MRNNGSYNGLVRRDRVEELAVGRSWQKLCTKKLPQRPAKSLYQIISRQLYLLYGSMALDLRRVMPRCTSSLRTWHQRLQLWKFIAKYVRLRNRSWSLCSVCNQCLRRCYGRLPPLRLAVAGQHSLIAELRHH